MRHIMPTGARLLDQFHIADVTAYAFLKVNVLPPDCAGRTGLLAHNAEFALWNALNAPGADHRDNPERSAKRASITAVESGYDETGGKESYQY